MNENNEYVKKNIPICKYSWEICFILKAAY